MGEGGGEFPTCEVKVQKTNRFVFDCTAATKIGD